MLSIITISDYFVTSTIAYVGEIFLDFSPLLLLVIGALLGFFVLEKIIGLFTHKE